MKLRAQIGGDSRNKAMRIVMAASAMLIIAGGCEQQGSSTPPPPAVQSDTLQTQIDALQEKHPQTPGFAISILQADDNAVGASSGVANPDGAPFNGDTRVRIASITKTFVAATALRLWEDGRLDLDASIAGLIDPSINAKIVLEGYDTDAITVRQLLTHTSGMAEHTTDDYISAIIEAPDRQWTRMDQIDALIAYTEPLGAPLEKFAYSDTGYILLGDIIERITGESLPASVRDTLKFDAIGLGGVWWDGLESTPQREGARAHQYIDGMDTYGWHGTLDAFGGGGIIASTAEMASFFSALFEGKVFESADTLDVMIASPGNAFADQYRYGLFPRTVDGIQVYGHSGFWGTLAYYAPALETAIAGASLDQSTTLIMRDAMDEALKDIKRAGR